MADEGVFAGALEKDTTVTVSGVLDGAVVVVVTTDEMDVFELRVADHAVLDDKADHHTCH